MEKKIGQAEVQLTNIEHRMPAIVKPYGYKNVQALVKDYDASKSDYEAYQQAAEKYEKGVYGKLAESIKERLERYDREVKERETNRPHLSDQRTEVADKEKVMEKHIVGEVLLRSIVRPITYIQDRTCVHKRLDIVPKKV